MRTTKSEPTAAANFIKLISAHNCLAQNILAEQMYVIGEKFILCISGLVGPHQSVVEQ